MTRWRRPRILTAVAKTLSSASGTSAQSTSETGAQQPATTMSTGGVGDCLRDAERAPTPPRVRRRQEEAAAAAARVRGVTHGVKSGVVDALNTVAAALSVDHGIVSDAARWRQEQAEAGCARNKVPLGAPRSHGVVLPPALASGAVAFGADIHGDHSRSIRELLLEGSTAGVIFPTEPVAPGVARLEPGFRATKGAVDWAKSAQGPDAAFGASSRKNDAESVADAFQDPAPVSAVSAARVAAFKAKKAAAPVAAAVEALKGHTFGVASATSDDVGAGQLVRGYGLTPEQVQPDNRVGHSQAGAAPVPESHSFGVPTVRRDLAPPKQRSMSDTRSFGDDAPMASLMSPSALEAFRTPLTAAELADVLRATGLEIHPPHVYQALFAKAAQMDNLLGQDKCRVATFQKVRASAGL